jgi:acyl-CoA reductase-like NAD-dependent aldehyde dehydrogenase
MANLFLGSKEVSRKNKNEIKNPFTKRVVSSYPTCSVKDTLKALKIANSAKKRAKESDLSQRIEWLLDVAEQLQKRREEFAKTITDEVGKPITFSRVEVDRCIETIKVTASTAVTFAGELYNSDVMPSGKKTISYFTRVPVGVVVAITPFNFPLNLVAHKIAPALVAGNSVVLKPTPEAPEIAYKFAKLFIDSRFAIKDALSVVYGDAVVGDALVTSDIPRVISFTGSEVVGRIIMKNAGIKKVSLELGGNAGTYIDKNADIEYSAQRCTFGAFVNSGQVCISLQRIYVHKDVYSKFAKAFVKETNKLQVGSPYDDKTFLSSLINEESLNRAISWVDSAISEGAEVLCGNMSDGLAFYPTIMGNVRDDMNIVCQEVFAPIVSLVKVENFDEAIEKLNSTDYGLQSSIFTNSLKHTKKAIDRLEAGGVVINDIPTLRFDIQPYGGVKLSGIGREGAKYALEEFTEIKSVVIC